MADRIIFRHMDPAGIARVAVVVPCGDLDAQAVIDGGHVQEIAAGEEHSVVQEESLPTGVAHSHYRDAWRWESGAENPLSIHLGDAKELHVSRWREVRKPMLERLDLLDRLATERGDDAERARISALRTELRDITASHDLSDVGDVEALSKIHPDVLTRSCERDGVTIAHDVPPWEIHLRIAAGRE